MTKTVSDRQNIISSLNDNSVITVDVSCEENCQDANTIG